jgi:RNA polymerase-interacting CarD/CdnL/TRCF family regulator
MPLGKYWLCSILGKFNNKKQYIAFLYIDIADSRLTPRTFYKNLLEQLGFQTKGFVSDAKRQLHREIAIVNGVDGVQVVTIVDEVHNG